MVKVLAGKAGKRKSRERELSASADNGQAARVCGDGESSPKGTLFETNSRERISSKGPVRNLVSASRSGYFLSPFSDVETDTWMLHYAHELSS